MTQIFNPFGSILGAYRASQHLAKSLQIPQEQAALLLTKNSSGLLALARYTPTIEVEISPEDFANVPPHTVRAAPMDVYLRATKSVMEAHGSPESLARQMQRLDIDRRTDASQTQIDIQFDGPLNTPLFDETPLVITIRHEDKAYRIDCVQAKFEITRAVENASHGVPANPEERREAIRILSNHLKQTTPQSDTVKSLYEILAIKPVALETLDYRQLTSLEVFAQNMRYALFIDRVDAIAEQDPDNADDTDGIDLIRNDDSGFIDEITLDPAGELTVTFKIMDPMEMTAWRLESVAGSESQMMQPTVLTSEEYQTILKRLETKLTNRSMEDAIVLDMIRDFILERMQQSD